MKRTPLLPTEIAEALDIGILVRDGNACRIDPGRLTACQRALGLPPTAGLSLVLRQWGMRG